MSAGTPEISVVVPTRDRAAFLADSLESLVRQTLAPDAYEVIVVDDGSEDDTAAVCEKYEGLLPLRYHRIQPAGIAAAKNIGIFNARAPLLLFFDDDDCADEDLLRAHVELHRLYAEERLAVLGFTTWAPWLTITPLMHYVTGLGSYLFSYLGLQDGALLDYTYFWGGRSSCKRSLLVREGVFDQTFTFGCEDIELGYRLSRRVDFQVVFSRSPISLMNRPLTYADFCRRCERQGRAQRYFGSIHPDPEIQAYTQVTGARLRWERARDSLAADAARVEALEASLTDGLSPAEWTVRLHELRQLYRSTFEAWKAKGIAETGPDAEAVEEPALTGEAA